jgi:predicted nucleic acid-binding protein
MNAAEIEGYFFLDTNVFIYAHDQSAPAKQRQAAQLIRDALSTGRGMISTQVIQEFLHTAAHKFEQPMTIAECRGHLQNVLEPLCTYIPSVSTYDHALRIVEATGFTLYDALILTAAIESGCRILLTEDLQHGRQIEGLTILNPFAE